MLNKKAALTSLYHMSMYVKHFEFTESQQCGRLCAFIGICHSERENSSQERGRC